MDWIGNLISYCEEGNVGKCPACGSEKVEVTEHTHGSRKSVTFTCKQCKGSDHFDGVTLDKQ